MSKECCGMIYSDDQDFCDVCGKELANEEIVKNDKSSLVDLIFEDEKDEKEEKKSKKDGVSAGIKVIGIVSLVMAIAGLALVAVCAYFMIFAPAYNKNGDSGNEIVLEELDSVTNPAYEVQHEYLGTATDATSTDAE